MTDVDAEDDFDRLAAAVARVLREAFTTAEGIRRDGLVEALEMQAALREECDSTLADARRLPSQVAQEAEAMRAALRATADEAAHAVAALIGEAQTEAHAILRTAREELLSVTTLVEAERARLDGELEELVREVRRSVTALEQRAEQQRHEAMERAAKEAAMILRQARLHHRHSAKEAERMLDAAVASANALRNAALEDAARIASHIDERLGSGPGADANVTPLRKRPQSA